MPVRLKKLIGTILLVALVCVYAIVATIFAVALLANASPWIHLIYFLGTGLLWVIPAMFIISWMEKAPKKKASIRPE
jgi:arginine exporter protein ArgO